LGNAELTDPELLSPNSTESSLAMGSSCEDLTELRATKFEGHSKLAACEAPAKTSTVARMGRNWNSLLILVQKFKIDHPKDRTHHSRHDYGSVPSDP